MSFEKVLFVVCILISANRLSVKGNQKPQYFVCLWMELQGVLR